MVETVVVELDARGTTGRSNNERCVVTSTIGSYFYEGPRVLVGLHARTVAVVYAQRRYNRYSGINSTSIYI